MGFLGPLLLGFALNAASAFTAAYSRRWGERAGQLVTMTLRVGLGIPLWVVGLCLVMREASPAVFASAAMTDALGWLLVATGCVPMLLAWYTLRTPAVAPSLHDALVAQGIYAHLRHPIYAGLLLEFVGMFLLRPTQAVALACALGVCWVHVQARLEEYDLLQRIPAYRAYMAQVPRFIPHLRRKQKDL
jgi:protein-S-isoprenylcysteine O-methyltransferase Ste14